MLRSGDLIPLFGGVAAKQTGWLTLTGWCHLPTNLGEGTKKRSVARSNNVTSMRGSKGKDKK